MKNNKRMTEFLPLFLCQKNVKSPKFFVNVKIFLYQLLQQISNIIKNNIIFFCVSNYLKCPKIFLFPLKAPYKNIFLWR